MSRSELPPARSGRPGWLTRILTSLGAVVALLVSFFLGALVFLTALGMLLLLAVGVAIRIWWLRRQFRRRHGDDDDEPPGGGDVIEGEYIVVRRQRQQRARTPD